MALLLHPSVAVSRACFLPGSRCLQHLRSPSCCCLPPPQFTTRGALLHQGLPCSCSRCQKNELEYIRSASQDHEDDNSTSLTTEQLTASKPVVLMSVTPLPLLALAVLPGAGAVEAVFGPFAELVRSWNLPEWLIHWGHPGNMAVVLLAMGGYGSYLGWQIRLSDNVVVKANAKDLHPKLLAGMFIFFALGATGGITSLLTSGKPIFESSHAVTGLTGLALLTVQTILTSFFESNPNLRTIHGFLGSGIMVLFLIHAALGLQLGLSS